MYFFEIRRTIIHPKLQQANFPWEIFFQILEGKFVITEIKFFNIQIRGIYLVLLMYSCVLISFLSFWILVATLSVVKRNKRQSCLMDDWLPK